MSAPRLTVEQEHAVARRGEPLLLSAAAGSGKTSVLVERFVRAVVEDGISPARILAITFTERAAGELRDRVRARLLALDRREAARDTEAAFVGTFHGFCARLLRTHPLMAGLDPDFSILDEGLAGRLRERAFKLALRRFLAGERPEAVALVAAYGVDRVAATIGQVHAELRSRGERAPRLPAPSAPAEPEALAACALLDDLLGAFGEEYEQVKARRAAVDFDDLELLAGELLAAREAVRRSWSERFELLMVDEFQDTNPRQLAILTALDRDNLFTVGDELQSIYGFRHADVRLFRARRAQLDEHGGALALTRNFRSVESVIEVVNTVFAGRFEDYAALVPGRLAEDVGAVAETELLLTSTRGWEESPQLAGAVAAGMPRAQAWRQAEAKMLARRVAELVAAGEARAGEVAVLLRATGDLEVFERALQRRGLRTLAAVGAFWSQQQVLDLASYLRALANPLDELALYEALASPLCGCSRDGLAQLAHAAREAGESPWAVLSGLAEGEEPATWLGAGDRARLAGFWSFLRREREQAPRHGLSELLDRAVRAGGYGDRVRELEWGARRMANVHKLMRLAGRFEAGEGRDLRGFLDHVDHLRATEAVEPDAPVEGVEPDAVRLMSIHAAKGLEFGVVCLADLGRQPASRAPDLLVDGERVGLRLARLDGERPAPALEYEALWAERREREAQEEDRILYVAMTRARERLLLSGAVDFERWPAPRSAPTPISWLGPALVPDLPERLAAAAPADSLLSGCEGVRCLLNTPANASWMLADAAPTAAGAHTASAERPAPAAAPASPPVEPPAPSSATPPAPAPPLTPAPASLSYTSLSELERCGYRFYLERVLGLGEERAVARTGEHGLEARARGIVVHALMEAHDFAGTRAPSARDVRDVGRSLGIVVGAEEAAAISSLVAGASSAPLAGRIAGARERRREHAFAFGLGESVITGVIDLLGIEEGARRLVLDYKSDRVGEREDLAALVEREYGLQRLVYALAVLRAHGGTVEVVHWFLQRPFEPVSASFAEHETEDLERRLSERVARAWAGGYAVSPRPHRALCLTCPGRAGLCSWGEDQTLRDSTEDS